MDHIEVTRIDEGKFTRIFVSKKHVVNVEPYPYIRAILLGISNFRHKEDYDF